MRVAVGKPGRGVTNCVATGLHERAPRRTPTNPDTAADRLGQARPTVRLLRDEEISSSTCPASSRLTPAQARVFQRIGPGGSRLTDWPPRQGSPSRAWVFWSTSSNTAGTCCGCPTRGRAGRLVRIAERGARSVEASRAIVTSVEAEWAAHLGAYRMAQLRRILPDLREITDP